MFPPPLSYLSERERERESAPIHGVIPPNAHDSQSWARLKLEARNAIQQSQQVCSYLSHHWLLSGYTAAGSWNWKGAGAQNQALRYGMWVYHVVS